MKKILILILLIAALGGAAWYFRFYKKTPAANVNQQTQKEADMLIQSPAFGNNQDIPVKYTCDSDGVNPPLEFKDVPKEAESLVLIMDDPDATIGTWTHWTLWNIDPSTASIPENSVPQKAVVGQGSSGQNVYGGPCPPSGTHHYHFKLYALNSKLSIPSYSDVKALNQAMQGLIISQAELIGLYGRK